MLTLTHAGLATVDQLFHYKTQSNAEADSDFPGSDYPWGLKAHNHAWIEQMGQFAAGQKIIEVGGGYSSLPAHIAETYHLEAWIGDDYGKGSQDGLWSRWGNPKDLPNKYPSVKYVFEPFGAFSPNYPKAYFDCIYSVSTLEHIPCSQRLSVFRNMNYCLKQGGIQLHTIDISTMTKSRCLAAACVEAVPLARRLSRLYSGIRGWINMIRRAGVKIRASIPNPIHLLDRDTLVEPPEIVYRFYPPNNTPKKYRPGASLLVVIEDL